jgi:hypothetical protein
LTTAGEKGHDAEINRLTLARGHSDGLLSSEDIDIQIFLIK